MCEAYTATVLYSEHGLLSAQLGSATVLKVRGQGRELHVVARCVGGTANACDDCAATYLAYAEHGLPSAQLGTATVFKVRGQGL